MDFGNYQVQLCNTKLKRKTSIFGNIEITYNTFRHISEISMNFFACCYFEAVGDIRRKFYCDKNIRRHWNLKIHHEIQLLGRYKICRYKRNEK